MTKNSKAKREARRYQSEHPGTTYPEALRESQRLYHEEQTTDSRELNHSEK